MKKKIGITIGVAFVVAAAGGSYLFSRKKNHSAKSAISEGFQALDDLKKAQGMTVNTHLNSPTGKAWKAKDFAALNALFGPHKTVKENHSFFQASIFVLDTTKPEWKPEEREGLHNLQNSIVDYMIAKRDKPVLGEEAQVISYASKVLLKFDSLSETAVQKMLSFYSASADHNNQKDIVAETLVRLNPLPEKARKIIRDKIQSKTTPYEGVLLLGQMRDAKAAADFWNEIYKNYSGYSDKVKPMVFKQMAINHQVIKGDLKKYLSVLPGKGEAAYEDAFLIGVRELNCVDEFRTEVQRIANQSQFPESKSLAGSILNSRVGTR